MKWLIPVLAATLLGGCVAYPYYDNGPAYNGYYGYYGGPGYRYRDHYDHYYRGGNEWHRY